MPNPIGWGILGTGGIAQDFADGLALLADAELAAVGSRTGETAQRFADRFGVPRRYPSYEELAADPDVDVVYVATPHNLHRDNTVLALEAGKAVLCEKPLAVNATEAREMIALARARGLFLMEAMWTRYNPVVVALRELLDGGAVGPIRMIIADLGFQPPYDPEGRLFNPELAGGGLLDLGPYPFAMASMVFGPPARIATLAHLGDTGVDERAGTVLGYEDGRIAILSTSLREQTPSEATFIGSEGRITLHGPLYRPSAFTVVRADGSSERVAPLLEGNVMHYEAAEVMRCLREGMLESPTMPLDESLSIMETMDRVRAEWGMRYPGE